MLGARFPKAQFVITGVLGPKSNAHGPNEFLHIDMGKRVTAAVSSQNIYIYSRTAHQTRGKTIVIDVLSIPLIAIYTLKSVFITS